MTNAENRQPAHQTLAEEAERLQTQINEFIGRATMAGVDLPAAVYDANAELLLLPARLGENTARRAAHATSPRNASNGKGGSRWRLKPLSR